MEIESLTIQVSDTIGGVSAELIVPPDPSAVMALAHGAGANMHHKFMKDLALALGEKGIATLRYNFPYMEKGRKGRPDPPAVAERTVRAALEAIHGRYPKLPVVAGGKSFGGRMTSQLASKDDIPFLKAIVFFGFPLHAPGKPGVDRAAHLANVKKPMLFHQGTRDTLASIALIHEVVSTLSKATLKEYDGADHSFNAGKRQLIPDIASATADWLGATL